MKSRPGPPPTPIPAPALDDECTAALLEGLKPILPHAARRVAMKDALMTKLTAMRPVVHHAPQRSPAAAWTRVSPLIETMVLFENDKTCARLVRLAPGGVVPGHRHEHDEAAWVVEGDCVVGEDYLTVGDYYMVPAGASHADIVSARGCMLLVQGPSGGNRRKRLPDAAMAL